MDYFDDYDPPVDESTTCRCEDCEEEWNPGVISEYQGVEPHGGLVDSYADGAFDCPICGQDCDPERQEN